jgi:N6-adenosine-specific RNA methylase IME4
MSTVIFKGLRGRFDVCVIDPPWRFVNFSAKGHRKGAAHHYKTMSLDDIKALPVAKLARRRGMLILMWTTGWMMAKGWAADVVRAWGAEPQSEIVWPKMTVGGKMRFGPGYRVRTRHEPILVATIGNPKRCPLPSVIAGIAREHSRKPDEFYATVKGLTPGQRRCNIFSAGYSHPGFIGWGRPHSATKQQNKSRHHKKAGRVDKP